MKLAGIVSISLGFVVVLLPSNLADIFLRILRWVSPNPVLKFDIARVCQPASLLQIEHEGMKILTQPSESSHIVCNSIWLLRFSQNGEAVEAGRDGDEEERARPAHRLHRLQAAIPIGQGQVKNHHCTGWGESWFVEHKLKETAADFQIIHLEEC